MPAKKKVWNRPATLQCGANELPLLREHLKRLRIQRARRLVTAYEDRTGYKPRTYRIRHDTYTALAKLKSTHHYTSYNALFTDLVDTFNQSKK